MPPTSPKILFYCVNGTGLGHLTRCLAIARQIRALKPEAVILFLTSSEHVSVLWEEGFPSVKVPSYEFSSRCPGVPISRLATTLTAQTFATFAPDVTVTDSLAGGMFGELISPLMTNSRKAFLYGHFPNYHKKVTYTKAFDLYDVYLVPFRPDEEEQLGIRFPGAQTFWTGDVIIRSRAEMLDRAEVQRRLALNPQQPALYVGLGGGGNPQNDAVYRWLLRQLAPVAEQGWQVVVPEQPLAPHCRWSSEFPFIKSIRHYPIAEYLNGFDLAISAAGFNCAEFVYAGIPSLWVPLGFPSTDQNFNAQRFASRGLGHLVPLGDNAALAAGWFALTAPGAQAQMADAMRAFLPENGAEAAARIILELSEVRI